jgi:hypothetical protein
MRIRVLATRCKPHASMAFAIFVGTSKSVETLGRLNVHAQHRNAVLNFKYGSSD